MKPENFTFADKKMKIKKLSKLLGDQKHRGFLCVLAFVGIFTT